MDVYWLEQTEGDVPAHDDWFGAGELTRLNAMRVEKRRVDWRLGRWTAKCAVASYLKLSTAIFSEIEIRAAESGAPEVFLAGEAAGVAISLSHRGGSALCVVAAVGAELGCDLEMVEHRSAAFVADYFTAEEQVLLALAEGGERSERLALLWSGKESVLKALQVGLRADTRSVAVVPLVGSTFANGGGALATQFERMQQENSARGLVRASDCVEWNPFSACFASEQVFQGWWRCSNNLLRTVVAHPSASQPIALLPAGETLELCR